MSRFAARTPARSRPATRYRTYAAVGLAVLALALPMLTVGPVPGMASRAHVNPAALTVPAPVTNTSVLDLGMPLNASVNVSQVTGGSGNVSNLSFAWSGLPKNCTSQNVSNYTCYPTATGTFGVSVNVTDWSDHHTGTAGRANITINTDPVVTNITASPSGVSVNQTVTFTVTASGGTAPLAYVYSGLPAGCSGNTSTVTCTPTTAAAYNVTVTVVDAVNFTSNTAYVEVHVTPTNAHSSAVTLSAGQWGIIVGILVVGLAIAGYLWIRARREDRIGRPPAPRSPPPPPVNPPPDTPPPGSSGR